MLLLRVIAPILLGAAVAVFQRRSIDIFLMGVFRDLGRIKARNRRMAQTGALVHAGGASNWDVLLRRDDPLAGQDLDSEMDDGGQAVTYTLEELEDNGQGWDGGPLLLSIYGRVYDVSAGEKFYGEGRPYHKFAGREVTRALSKGCFSEDCLVRSTEGLTEKQLAEGQRWLSFFQMHDKYPHVGNMEGESSEDWLEALVSEHLAAVDGIEVTNMEETTFGMGGIGKVENCAGQNTTG